LKVYGLEFGVCDFGIRDSGLGFRVDGMFPVTLAVLLERGRESGRRETCGGLGPCATQYTLEAGSYLRLMDSCITQLKAQGPSRTCNESNEEEEEEAIHPACRGYVDTQLNGSYTLKPSPSQDCWRGGWRVGGARCAVGEGHARQRCFARAFSPPHYFAEM